MNGTDEVVAFDLLFVLWRYLAVTVTSARFLPSICPNQAPSSLEGGRLLRYLSGFYGKMRAAAVRPTGVSGSIDNHE